MIILRLLPFCHVFLVFREAFLSSGDVASYQSVSDNMTTALPLLSDSIQTDMFALTLPVPRPLDTRGSQVGLVVDTREENYHIIYHIG